MIEVWADLIALDATMHECLAGAMALPTNDDDVVPHFAYGSVVALRTCLLDRYHALFLNEMK